MLHSYFLRIVRVLVGSKAAAEPWSMGRLRSLDPFVVSPHLISTLSGAKLVGTIVLELETILNQLQLTRAPPIISFYYFLYHTPSPELIPEEAVLVPIVEGSETLSRLNSSL
jgi:hypothetical protein